MIRAIRNFFNLRRRCEHSEQRGFGRKQHPSNGSAITAHRHLYDRPEFLRHLYLERRRTERSCRPLCLILLDGTDILGPARRDNIFQQLFKLIRPSVRDTDVIGWYEHNSTLGVIFSGLRSVDNTVLNYLYSKITNAITLVLPPELAKCLRISLHVFPSNNNAGTWPMDLTFYPDLPQNNEVHKLALVIKRSIDVVVSLLLICLLAPLFALIALIIKLTSAGPVIFTQARVGEQGRPFNFWKFRSMYVDSDAAIHKDYVTKFISQERTRSQSEDVYKIRDDPRVTPVGRFLRKTSLDELPQLWNVFRGDMSLVGPRPPLPYELECYALWHYRRILEAKPGLTGLWQVTGRSRTTFNEMVRLDLRYVQQWSIWLDVKILLQTPKAVLMGEGAY